MSGVGCLRLWVKNVKHDNTMLLKVTKNYKRELQTHALGIRRVLCTALGPAILSVCVLRKYLEIGCDAPLPIPYLSIFIINYQIIQRYTVQISDLQTL